MSLAKHMKPENIIEVIHLSIAKSIPKISERPQFAHKKSNQL